MNKTLIGVAIILLVAVMFIGVIAIAILRPDATATMIAFAGGTLTSITGFIVIFYTLNKSNERIEKIERQTNGINTALLTSITSHGEDTIKRFKGENSD